MDIQTVLLDGVDDAENERYISCHLREQVHNLFDADEHIAALGLTLDLVKMKRVPPPSIYVRVMHELVKSRSVEVSVATYSTLKQTLLLLDPDSRESAWRPSNAQHWTYICSIIRELTALESGMERMGYATKDEKHKIVKKKRKNAPSGDLSRPSKKTKSTARAEFFKTINSAAEEFNEASPEARELAMLNRRLFLKYIISIFQENIRLRPPKQLNHLYQLINCPADRFTEFGSNEADRMRHLIETQIFGLLQVGGHESRGLMQCLLEQLFYTYDPTHDVVQPYLRSGYASLPLGKKCAFLETIHNPVYKLSVLNMMLQSAGSEGQLTADQKKLRNAPITVFKITRYCFKLEPAKSSDVDIAGVNKRDILSNAEEELVMLLSHLLQCFLFQCKPLTSREKEELSKDTTVWLKRRARKAAGRMEAYLHRIEMTVQLAGF